MSAESTIDRDHDGTRAAYRIRGSFDRAGAWGLRDRLERDPASAILLDFTLVRDFSDLAVAVLAHGVAGSGRHVVFRGLRERELRILRYCGVPVDEARSIPPVVLPQRRDEVTSGEALGR